MIFFDTETTGIVLPGVEDLAQQPRIVEIACVSMLIDRPREKWPTFERLVNPGIPIPEETTRKSHGITDAMVEGAPSFVSIVRPLINFWRADPDGAVVCHNIAFDTMMLVYELRRLGLEHRFPYCFEQVDTVTLSGGKKLEKWAAELGVLKGAQRHRALADVWLMIDCYEEHFRQLEVNVS